MLQEFLASYPGPAPLLFPKRLDPAPGETRSAAVSRFDDVFASNPHLAWVHASFESESGGVVRQWADWVEVCGTDGTHLLASAPARLSLLLDPLPVGLTRSTPPSLSGACSRDADPARPAVADRAAAHRSRPRRHERRCGVRLGALDSRPGHGARRRLAVRRARRDHRRDASGLGRLLADAERCAAGRGADRQHGALRDTAQRAGLACASWRSASRCSRRS